jgi:hypothetical protein
VLNASPRPATITELQTLRDANTPVASLDQAQVTSRAVLVGDYPATPSPVTAIPPGRTVVLALENVYPDAASVPRKLTHRVSATFSAVPAGQAGTADKYPDQATEVGGPVTINSATPVVIGPPVAGTGWSVSNGCCALNAHRDVILPVSGRLNASERFAIDWVKFDLTQRPLATDGIEMTFVSDPTKNESYLAFGQPTIAVADGTVVEAVGDQPDAPPRTIVPDIPFDQLTGNHIILDLGNGVCTPSMPTPSRTRSPSGPVTGHQGPADRSGRQLRQHHRSAPALPAHELPAAPVRRPGDLGDRRLHRDRHRHHRRRAGPAITRTTHRRLAVGRHHLRLRGRTMTGDHRAPTIAIVQMTIIFDRAPSDAAGRAGQQFPTLPTGGVFFPRQYESDDSAKHSPVGQRAVPRNARSETA